jgi:hypothetical protein
MNRGNEPALVATNVEYIKAFTTGANVVDALESLFQFGETFETASTRGFEP